MFPKKIACGSRSGREFITVLNKHAYCNKYSIITFLEKNGSLFKLLKNMQEALVK